MTLGNKQDEQSRVVVKATIPIALKTQFKVLCVERHLKMSQVIEGAIQEWIETPDVIALSIPCCVKKDDDSEEIKSYLSPTLKTQFKALCAKKRVKMQQVTLTLIHHWINCQTETRQ
ncbi:MAG: hypothetical protein GVY17_00255 [Cyanobacteria bacterium]|nr:hypothetical protein [Cyanobacteria bacterium GSL.Bin21]